MSETSVDEKPAAGGLPYDTHPKTPETKLPAGACDAHCHVFGPGNVFPYAPGRTYTPVDAGKETLFALHRHLGIDRSVIVQASCHGKDNTAMLDAIANGGGNYKGIAMVDADVAEDELKRLDAGGIKGVRFNFVSHLGADADIDGVLRVVDKIGPLGWHLVVHFDANRLETLAPVLKRIPLTMVIDHMGRVDASLGLEQPAFRLLVELMQDERFWVKVSGCERVSRAGPPFHDAVPFARTLVETFPDRVLWGTDFPHPNVKKFMPNDGELVDLLPLIAPTEVLMQSLLVDNPTRLYWS